MFSVNALRPKHGELAEKRTSPRAARERLQAGRQCRVEKRVHTPVGPPRRPAPVRADAGSVRRAAGTGLWQPRPRRAVPLLRRREMSSLRYRGGRRRRVHFGIESPTAGMVPGALPQNTAGGGPPGALQFRLSSQPARNARRSARRNPRLGAIAAGLAYCFCGNTGKRGNRTLGAPRGGCVGAQADAARDTRPGDIRRSSEGRTPCEAHAAGGREKGGRGNWFGGSRLGA